MTWSDNHISKFDIEWLIERSFSDENRKHYLEEQYQPPLALWAKKQFEMKTFQAADVFDSNEGICTYPSYFYLKKKHHQKKSKTPSNLTSGYFSDRI